MGVIKRLKAANQKIDQIVREEIDEPRREAAQTRRERPQPPRRR